MTTPSTSTYQSALTFPFTDPHWAAKLGIGAGLILAGLIIPIIPLIFLAGYLARMVSGIVFGERQLYGTLREMALPEWDDWGGDFNRGVKIAGAYLVYTLPWIIILILTIGLMFAPAILPVLEETGRSIPEAVFPVVFGAAMASIPLTLLVILLSIFLTFIAHVAITHVAVSGEFSAAFRFKEWGPILRRNFAGFFLAALLMYGISMLLSLAIQMLSLTMIFCFLIPFASAAIGIYTYVASAALFAQAYAAGRDQKPIS